MNGIDPSGEAAIVDVLATLAIQGLKRGLKLGVIGVVGGAAIGAIDAALGGEDIVAGAIGGAKWGGAIGFGIGFLGPLATTFFAPAVITAILNLGAGASLALGAAGAYDSFSSGHTAQGVFRLALGAFGGFSLRQSATRPTKPVNIGGEGEVPNAINLQPRWALSKDYGRSQPSSGGPEGRSLGGMIAEGHEFLIYNAYTRKLPFADNSVPRIHTNGGIPIDRPKGFFPDVKSSEIRRVLQPGGQWLVDGKVVFVKP